MKSLIKLFQNQKCFFLFALLCSIGSITINLLWNKELSTMINLLQIGHTGWNAKIPLCFFLLCTAALFQGGITLFSSYAGESAVHILRLQVADTILRRSYDKNTSDNSDELLSLQINELEEVNQYVSDSLFPLITDIISFFFTLVYLLYQNFTLTLLCNIPVLFLFVYTSASGKIIYRYTQKEQETLQRMNSISQTALSLFPILRIYQAEGLLQNKYEESILTWKKAVVTQESVKAKLMSLSGMLSTLPLLLLLLIGGTMVINGTFSIGMLYIFINLSGNVSGVMVNMPGHIAGYHRFCGCLNRVWQFLEKNGGRNL